MQVLKIIFILLEVLLLFNLLIFVHELGHFLAARWRGLKVDRFSIWFGKPIWKTKVRGVEYCLGSIPAGGYVALPQMATMEALEGKAEHREEPLPPISPLDKIIVAFAGPLFSFGLALVFAVIVMFVGRPVSEKETTTIVGAVIEDGPAATAGIQPGDRVLEIDGKPVTKYGGMGDSIVWRVVRSEGEVIPIKVQRGNEVLTFQVTPVKERTKAWQRKALRRIEIDSAQSAIIAKVFTNSPAAAAGLQPRDQVLAVNGAKLFHYSGLGDYIEQHRGEPLTLTVVRNGKPFEVQVTPEVPLNAPEDDKPKVGILWDSTGQIDLAYPGAIEQVKDSVNAMIDTFGALFSRKSDIKPQHLGGAIKIINVYYLLFVSEHGWRQALWFSVLLNVNLALLNLLPIPVLDGGHIVLALIEALRRRPVNARIVNVVQTGCAVLLIGYMLYIAFYDIQDLPWRSSKESEPAMQFAPKGQPAR